MEILLLTTSTGPGNSAGVLPALDLLPHTVRTAPRDVRALVTGTSPDIVIIDARTDLADARATARMLHATGLGVPLSRSSPRRVWSRSTPTGASTTSSSPPPDRPRPRPGCDWPSAGCPTARPPAAGSIRAGELSIDPDTYAAKLKGRPLDLTYKEFELLKFLAQHPGRVFTRDQLLREVWGYDYFGGTRTVDVHVRRLRAKLGSEYESMIGTVRQVGYKFVVPPSRMLPDPDGKLPLVAPRERTAV